MKIFYSSGGLNEVPRNVDVVKKGKQVCQLESSARTDNLFYQLLWSVVSFLKILRLVLQFGLSVRYLIRLIYNVYISVIAECITDTTVAVT